MKVHIHPRREWRQPGRATGGVRCKLVLPAIDHQLTQSFRLKPKEIWHDRDEEDLELGDAITRLLGVRPEKP